MAKSHKHKQSIMKSIYKTADKTLPVVDKGLKKVGTTTKNVVSASIPVIEKGVSVVYGTMATGLDLGVKGAKSITKGLSKSRRLRSRKVSRSRSLSGGRKSRRIRHRRH